MSEVQRDIKIEASWRALLGEEFSKPYMQNLSRYLRAQKQAGKRIFPPGEQIFAAFDATPVERVKVVVIGQDPYHGPGQAHGLCFSVQPGVDLPPSLRNIYTEIAADLNVPADFHRGNGCLTSWAEQGVLLLNSVLTVEQGRAGAHQGQGWEEFTDAAVTALAANREGLVFLLWGSYAQKKVARLDGRRHCLLRAPHPSPLSAHRGFFGCRHFSKANEFLHTRGVEGVDWTRITPAAG